MESTNLENEVILFQFKEGILYGKYKVPKVDLATAQFATTLRFQITQGKKVPALADISCVKNIDKDARGYFSSNEAGDDLAALGIVVSNPVTQTLGNFFLRFNLPDYPCRLFTNVEDAITWIKQYM